MFITKKITKNTVGAACIILAVVILLIIRLSSCGFTKNSTDSPIIGVYSLLAADNEGCIDFLGQFALEVEPEPNEVTTVKIPAQFNNTFKQYNDLQKEQGLDLTPYKEKECERRTYKVLNYEAEGEVLANLLIYNGKVIGGDVCSVALDGFMETFDAKVPH